MALVAWLREFRRTLEIIVRTLREVVNRVRLCGHHNPESCSRGEVHVDFTETCLFVCLFVCLFMF